MRSCEIVAQTLLLTATPMGYDFERVAELIHLPEDRVIAMFVAIDKGTKKAWPCPG